MKPPTGRFMIWRHIWVSRTTLPVPIMVAQKSTGVGRPSSLAIFPRRTESSVVAPCGIRQRSRRGSLAGLVVVLVADVASPAPPSCSSGRLSPARERRQDLLALTLKQPWASAVVELGKDVENRSWTTPFRGEFAIHAGRSTDESASAVGARLTQRLPSGCVVAVATLVDVVRDSSSEWADEGLYHWVIDGVRPLVVPVPCVGRQSLFKLPLDVERDVLAALVSSVGGE